MLQTKNLTYALKDQYLIQNINLIFHPGKLYVIVGPNGSGKSTFLKVLTGIWKPTAGQVLWNQVDLLSQKRQMISQTISLVPQQQQIHFDFTVNEFVLMGRYTHGRSLQKQDFALVQEMLLLVDAKDLQHRKISQLSQGERQRVYIARALATESPILALDEPTSSLDIRHQLEIWNLLLQLRRQNKTLIVAHHDLKATERYADHIAVINQGQCLASGGFQETLTPHLLQEVFGVQAHVTASGTQFELP